MSDYKFGNRVIVEESGIATIINDVTDNNFITVNFDDGCGVDTIGSDNIFIKFDNSEIEKDFFNSIEDVKRTALELLDKIEAINKKIQEASIDGRVSHINDLSYHIPEIDECLSTLKDSISIAGWNTSSLNC